MDYEKVNAMARSICGMPKSSLYTVRLRNNQTGDAVVELNLSSTIDLERLAVEKAVSLWPETKAEDYRLESVRY